MNRKFIRISYSLIINIGIISLLSSIPDKKEYDDFDLHNTAKISLLSYKNTNNSTFSKTNDITSNQKKPSTAKQKNSTTPI